MPATISVPAGMETRELRLLTGIFWIFVSAAVMLAFLVIFLPSEVFLAISNYLQILAAFAGAGALAFLYLRSRSNHVYPYAAGALALWGLSNIAWYVNVAMGLHREVFPSFIDMGIVASILCMMAAYQNGLAKKPCSPVCLFGLLILVLAIPSCIILADGLSVPTMVMFLYFFASGSLLITALCRGIYLQPVLFSGTFLFSLAFMIYPIRELFFPANPILSVIGCFVAAGISLIVLGLFRLPPVGAVT